MQAVSMLMRDTEATLCRLGIYEADNGVKATPRRSRGRGEHGNAESDRLREVGDGADRWVRHVSEREKVGPG